MVVRAKPGIITPSHRRENHGVHRTDTLRLVDFYPQEFHREDARVRNGTVTAAVSP